MPVSDKGEALLSHHYKLEIYIYYLFEIGAMAIAPYGIQTFQ